MSKVKIVIIPGNGGGDVEHSNWYGWLRDKLREVRKRFKQRALNKEGSVYPTSR